MTITLTVTKEVTSTASGVSTYSRELRLIPTAGNQNNAVAVINSPAPFGTSWADQATMTITFPDTTA